MRHQWLTNKCISCGLLRVREGRGKDIYHTYSRQGYKVDYEKFCIPQSQGRLFATPFDDEVLEECGAGGEVIENIQGDARSVSEAINKTISIWNESAGERVAEVASRHDVLSSYGFLTLSFDPDSKLFGEISLFKIYIISTINIPRSLEETIKDTYPYAADIALHFMQIVPCRPSVLVCINKNEKIYKAWRGMKDRWKEEL